MFLYFFNGVILNPLYCTSTNFLFPYSRKQKQKEHQILLLTHRFSLPKLAFDSIKNDQTFCPKNFRPPVTCINLIQLITSKTKKKIQFVKNQSEIDDLPNEIIYRLFDNLGIESIVSFSLTCK